MIIYIEKLVAPLSRESSCDPVPSIPKERNMFVIALDNPEMKVCKMMNNYMNDSEKFLGYETVNSRINLVYQEVCLWN